MYRAPLLVGQGDDGRTLQARQYVDDLLQTGLGRVHAYILLILSVLHRLEAEEHLLQDLTLLLTQVLVADEQGLTLHHYLYLAQVVAHQRRARGYDVEDTVGQSDARTDLYRTRDHVDLGLDTLLVEEMLEDGGIARGNLLAVEPLCALIVYLFGDGQRQAALRESQSRDDVGILAALHELVLSDHTDVGHTTGYTLWNIVIAEVKHLQRKVRRLYEQRALRGAYLDVCLAEQIHRVVEQTSL